MTRFKHTRDEEVFRRQVRVALIGAGGTGSMVLSGLVRLHSAMVALGHPGVDVTVWDPDDVSDANIGRQLFYRADIGTNKAFALVNRINLCFGLEWEAEQTVFSRGSGWGDHYGVFIVCVDSRKARKETLAQIKDSYRFGNFYLIDCGNTDRSGQVLMGHNGSENMPMPYEILPELVSDEPEEDKPSCSLAEALESQDLFVNQFIATHALQLLWQIFRHGGSDINGYYINLVSGKVTPSKIQKAEKKRKKESEKPMCSRGRMMANGGGR